MLDNGPKMGKKFDNRYGEQSGGKFSTLSERQSPGTDKSKTSMEKQHGSSRSEPPCPFRTCKAKGAKHLIKKCPEATEEEKAACSQHLLLKKQVTVPHGQQEARPLRGPRLATKRSWGLQVALRMR